MKPVDIVNPFPSWKDEGMLFELMADGEWHKEEDLRNEMHNKGRSKPLTPRYDRIIAAGRTPVPPKYPLGRWTLERRRGGLSRIQYFQEVDSALVDKKVVEGIVEEAVKGRIKEIVKDMTDEQMTLVLRQVEELKKTAVPILELQSFDDSGKKLVKKIEPAHESMTDLLYYLNHRDHVYLYDGHGNSGPGSGKTTAAIMAAMALQLGSGFEIFDSRTGKKSKVHFGYISLTPQTFESRLFGFIDGNGKYVSTDFRKCYEHGGVFIIDEMDNGGGNLYTALNGALENNYCSFPDRVIKRHKDFVVVGSGNTSGGGPNPMFPTRRPFDKAYSERFTYLAWNYDEKLERTVALAINADVAPVWHDYLVGLRKYCKQHFPMILVSPRATFKGCKYMKDSVVSIEKMLDAIIWKGYDQDSVTKILNACPVPSEKLAAARESYLENHRSAAKKSVRYETKGAA